MRRAQYIYFADYSSLFDFKNEWKEIKKVAKREKRKERENQRRRRDQQHLDFPQRRSWKSSSSSPVPPEVAPLQPAAGPIIIFGYFILISRNWRLQNPMEDQS